MKYYFNTRQQIQGDEAYNEKNFELALVHYKKAFSILNQIASQRNFKPTKPFYDELAYVLNEIITTKADYIMSSLDNPLNYKQVKNLWKEIPNLLHEMLTVYEKIRFFELRETQKGKINLTYKALANCCEAISDTLIDSVDEGRNEIPAFEQINAAFTWLTQAVNYRKKAHLPIAIEVHIGYLNLLERMYKESLDKQFLTKITTYIQENSLRQKELLPIQELEILSYQLLVATEHKDQNSVTKYEKQYNKLIANSEPIDHDSLIIEDIHKLLSKRPHSALETKTAKAKPRKRRKMIIEDSDDEFEPSEPMTTSPNSMENGDMPLAALMQSGNATTSEINTHKNQTPIMNQQFNSDWSHVVSSETVIAMDAQRTTQPSVFSAPNNATFFTHPSTSNTSVRSAQLKPTDAFVKVMEDLSHHYRDPSFLANLLSLIGDFYYKARSLPFKNIPLIPFEIYETVLRLDPQHSVAHFRLAEIYNKSHSNRRMINDHSHYGTTPSSSSKPQSFVDIFNIAVEENMLQIETFLSINQEKQKDVVKEMLQFIAHNIIEKNIAGNKSQLIANELFIQYSELLLSLEATRTELNMSR